MTNTFKAGTEAAAKVPERILYVCESCADNNLEGCAHFDRRDVRVTPNGQWLCEGCFEGATFGKDDEEPLWRDLPPAPEYGPLPLPTPATDGERAVQLFGTDVNCLAMLLHLVQRVSNFNEGPFQAGWEAAIEEAGAYLDGTHNDGGDQVQTLMEQMIGLVSGVYALAEVKGPMGVVSAPSVPPTDGEAEKLAWRSDIENAPPVERGCEREFIVAVYRAHSGKAYTFAASYLNAHPLEYRHECPKWKADAGCSGEGCDDGCPTTGWFLQTGDDYASMYNRLEIGEGDVFLGWTEIPKWNGPLPRLRSQDRKDV